jgi:cytochrome c oxidase subunit IV
MSQHHEPNRTPYFLVFAALMVLTAATVLVAKLDLGPLNDIVAMSVAIFKGSLVVWIFMHVRYGSRLTKLIVVSGFLWLILLIGITLSDYLTRPFSDDLRGAPHETPSTPPGGQVGDDRLSETASH